VPRTALIAFRRSLQNLDYTRERMEKLYAADLIALGDLHSVYEALFLRAVTSFETFLEDLFMSILERRTRYSSQRVSLRMKTISREALLDILLQGDDYLQWLPYANTERRARLYLRDGKPFCELDDGNKSVLKTITTIRNAIAHQSSYATELFQNKVIGSLPLLRGERNPAGFLRSQVRGGPVQNRFEVYAGTLARIAVALC
jgi:hypothetical protein